jgi:hypothetical protein
MVKPGSEFKQSSHKGRGNIFPKGNESDVWKLQSSSFIKKTKRKVTKI